MNIDPKYVLDPIRQDTAKLKQQLALAQHEHPMIIAQWPTWSPRKRREYLEFFQMTVQNLKHLQKSAKIAHNMIGIQHMTQTIKTCIDEHEQVFTQIITLIDGECKQLQELGF